MISKNVHNFNLEGPTIFFIPFSCNFSVYRISMRSFIIQLQYNNVLGIKLYTVLYIKSNFEIILNMNRLIVMQALENYKEKNILKQVSQYNINVGLLFLCSYSF